MPYKVFNFISSAATTSNKQYVGAHDQAFLVVSGMTQWAAGTNNETISIRGGLSATDTHAAITSMSVVTFSVKGVYPLPYSGLHYMSLGFNTAPTGTASVDVVLYSKSEDG